MAFNFHPSYQVPALALAASPVIAVATAVTATSSSSRCITDEDIRRDLERDGRCPDCGRQTHQLHYNANAVVVHKEPLTIDKVVYRGQCLSCLPVAEVYERTDSGGSGSGNSVFDMIIPQQPQQQVMSPALIPQLPHQLHAISEEHDNAQQQQQENQDSSSAQQQQQDTNENDDDDDDDDDDEIFEILCRMRRSPTDLLIQTTSFHALWVLSWETDNARAIGHVGGIPILLQSLRYHLNEHLNINNRYNRNNHTSSPSSMRQMQLQSNGLATIQNLSVNKLNKELLVSDEHQGIPLLLLSMSTFLHNAEIQRSGCHALANILSNGGCFKFAILNYGGLEAVTNAVEMHADNEGVVKAAYKCSSLLGQTDFSRRGFRRMEGGMTDDEASLGDNVSMGNMDLSARSASEHTL